MYVELINPNNGKSIKRKDFIIEILQDIELDNNIAVGYTATKRLGGAVIRNKAKIYWYLLFFNFCFFHKCIYTQ